MKFSKTAVLAAGLLAAGLAQASVVIDFNAVALRGAGVAPHDKPTVSESADGSHAYIGSLVAGQKAYYGTSYFGGTAVGAIDSIVFDYRPQSNVAPYVNFTVTKGSTTAVLSFALGYQPLIETTDNVKYTATYDLTPSTLMRLVEINNGSGLVQSNVENVAFSNYADWTLLTGDRALSPGELLPAVAAAGPRGAVSDSLVIMWGDSSNNYSGEKEIFNVKINTLLASGAQGEQYVAGNVVPEPASLALAGIALLGLAATRRRRS